MQPQGFHESPAAIVSNYDRAGELIQEARAIDATMKADITRCSMGMLQRGNILIKAYQLCGKGQPWRDHLAKVGWSERTARRYMAQATEKAAADMVAAFASHTHKVLDDKADDPESGEDGPSPMSANERKILIFLIGTVKPGLAKKLRDGTKKLSDTELRAACPPSCDRCMRGAMIARPGRPCEACEKRRSDKKAGLFDEPENEGDAASPPKPSDPYGEVKKLVTKLSGLITKLAGEDVALYEALKVCRVMDHVHGQSPRFRALAGVKKLIEDIEAGETLGTIKRDYDIASGGFVPPMYERKGRR